MLRWRLVSSTIKIIVVDQLSQTSTISEVPKAMISARTTTIIVIPMATKMEEINMTAKDNTEIIDMMIIDVLEEAIEGINKTSATDKIGIIKGTKKAVLTIAVIGAIINATGRITIITREETDRLAKMNSESKSKTNLTKNK